LALLQHRHDSSQPFGRATNTYDIPSDGRKARNYVRKPEVRVRWVDQQPDEMRSPRAAKHEGFQKNQTRRDQHTPSRGRRKGRGRLTFEQAIALAANIQEHPHIDKPVVVVVSNLSWALPGKAVT
jgi:hypothetical protein